SGRGSSAVRGALTGIATFVGGTFHALPFLISDTQTALKVAYVVVAMELLVIAWVRRRFLQVPLHRSLVQVTMGGSVVARLVAASRMTTANELILMRAVMGVSGAFIMPISLAVLPTIFSEQERPRAIAIGGAGMFLGLPLGPLVAGWLLTHYEWGSIFLINAPIVVVALIGVWLFIPESRDSNAPRLDFVGAVLAIAGVTS